MGDRRCNLAKLLTLVLLAECLLACINSDILAEESGPAVAIERFTGTLPDGQSIVIGGLHSLLIVDVIQKISKCQGKVVEWDRRADVIRELEFQHGKYGDPATAAKLGQLIQPDIMVSGVITGDGDNFSWKIAAKSVEGGDVVAEDTGTDRLENILDFTDKVADRLVEKICEQRAGYTISGQMDQATVNGTICGSLDKPFTATSPEVGGHWKFTPTSPSAGSFTYRAASVGGVPGSGGGTYVIQQTQTGGEKIQLSGSGSIHSPVGTFTAKITEALTLTPVKTCGKKGFK